MENDDNLLAGRYRLGEVLGRGGMADVHRATDEVLERSVAVKVLRDLTTDPAARARFTAEARTVAQLSHPSLVTVLDAGADDHDRPFLVLELVEGSSLADLLPQVLPGDQVARIGAQVGAALAHAHAAGIVHRDVKPGNVLLGQDGRARLTDFGIARILAEAAGNTMTGVTVGTAAYLSPEQVRGDAVTPATDVYSLGLVLLEALTGRRVYPGSVTESAVARLHAPPPIPSDLPDPWRDALAAMTHQEPDRRPAADALPGIFERLTGDVSAVDEPLDTRVLTGLHDRQPSEPDPQTEGLRPSSVDRAAWLRRLPGGAATLAAATAAAVLVLVLAVRALAGINDEDAGSEAEQVPSEVPAQLQEPLSDLHAAVNGTEQ